MPSDDIGRQPAHASPIVRALKPATADELNKIAHQMVDAANLAEAEQLKQQYLARFYRLPSHAE
jgi:hypothetical protein